jgi:hypothetical protein
MEYMWLVIQWVTGLLQDIRVQRSEENHCNPECSYLYLSSAHVAPWLLQGN